MKFEVNPQLEDSGSFLGRYMLVISSILVCMIVTYSLCVCGYIIYRLLKRRR